MQEDYNFLKQKIKNYYVENIVPAPVEIEKREFGTGDFGKKINLRHLFFSSINELNDFLKKDSPFFISYSPAFYEFPDRRPMVSKKFIGSDLIYEFDADDLATDCKEEHDSWKCSCGEEGKGNPELCPKCGLRVEVEEWICRDCLNETKKQTFKLIDVLGNDFSFNEGIFVNFSGNKGYHIHIRNEAVKNLSHSARIELLDYLTANELSLESLGFHIDKKNFLSPKPVGLTGWSGKLMASLFEFFKNAEESELVKRTGTNYPTAKRILAGREKILSNFDKGLLSGFYGKRAEEFWNSLLNSLVDDLKLEIDRQTSVDIYKIVRLPETIHGGTGLVAKNVDLEKLKEFKPLDDSIAFGNESVKVKISKTPKFYLGGKEWGPFNQEEVELPEFVAGFLIARNSAGLM